MRILEFLACVYASLLFFRTESLWHEVFQNLTVEYNILNLVLSLGAFLILAKMWVIVIRTRFKTKEEKEK